MKLTDMPETVIDWQRLQSLRADGASGAAEMRSHRAGDTQVRLVTYGAGYVADHWCSKGHIAFVVSGSLTIEHENGSDAHRLSAGMSWCVADDRGPAHRVRTEQGATIFIVD